MGAYYDRAILRLLTNHENHHTSNPTAHNRTWVGAKTLAQGQKFKPKLPTQGQGRNHVGTEDTRRGRRLEQTLSVTEQMS